MAGQGKIKVLIVDDILESRDNVAKLLRFEPDVQIVGLAENGEDGIDLAFRLEPDIILMDINMPGIDGISATMRITSRLPNTAVIMMSVQNEPDYLRRSMMAGAREFLAKPFSLDELVESIRHVHQLSQSSRRVVTVQESSPVQGNISRNKKAQVISLFSLKGGVGRSTVAANLAVSIRNQRPEKDVALIDGNLLHGDIGVILNTTDNKTITDIVRNFQTMDRDLVTDILVTHSSGVKVLLAPPDAQSGEQVTGEHVRQIIEMLHMMMDFIIVDTRPSFDEATLTFLDHSDRVLLMLTLELTAIKGAKQYLELSDLLGYESDKISLVMNRASAISSIPIADVEGSLRGEVVAKLPDDAVLVTRSINEGVPFVQSAPAHPLSVEIGKLAQWIMKGDSEKVEEIDPQIVQARKGIGRFMPPMAKRKAG